MSGTPGTTITDDQIISLEPGQRVQDGILRIERGRPSGPWKIEGVNMLFVSRTYAEGTVVGVHDLYLVRRCVPGLYQYFKNCLDAEAVVKGYEIS